jgi:hypothetical protein
MLIGCVGCGGKVTKMIGVFVGRGRVGAGGCVGAFTTMGVSVGRASGVTDGMPPTTSGTVKVVVANRPAVDVWAKML